MKTKTKTIKTIQWVGFLAVVLGVFVTLIVVMPAVMATLTPVIGSGVSFVLLIIAAWAAGAVLTYASVMGWFWLAERGWFV